MNPKVQVKGRKTLVRKQIPILLQNLQFHLNTFLETELNFSKGVAFTTDIWTSKAMHSYISLTLHIIDTKFTLWKFVLDCRAFEARHTGEEIMDRIDSMIRRINHLKPETRRTMVCDGATNLKKAMADSLEITDQHTCLAHIISNALKDALNVKDVAATVQKCRDLATCTHKSVQRLDKIREKCRELNGMLNYVGTKK